MFKAIAILDRESIQNFAEAGVVAELLAERARPLEHFYRRGCHEAAAYADHHAVGQTKPHGTLGSIALEAIRLRPE